MSSDDAPVNAPTPSIDLVRLAAWMDEAGLPDAGAPLTAKVISGGSQNEIFEIRRGDFHAALRKPPATAAAGRDEGILREWRIIEALDGTDVPHTKAYAVCKDPTVLGGTFYLMGFVDGWSPMNHRDGWPEPFNSNVEDRRGLAFNSSKAWLEWVPLIGRVRDSATSESRRDSTTARLIVGWRFMSE